MKSQYAKIEARLWKTLQRRPVMPLLGIQYRLCEVGTNRVEHHRLCLAIQRLLAEEAIVEAAAGVFVSSRETAQLLNRDIQEVSRVWVARSHDEHESAVTTITNRIGEQLEDFGVSMGVRPQTVWSSSNERLPTFRSRHVDVNSPRMAATIWISWNEEAICPSQSSFWTFLEHCHNRGRVPFIVARAVSTLTFPVLKVIGARAVQYYCVPTPLEGDDLLELQKAADRFGLPAVRPAAQWGQLPVVNALRTQLNAMSTTQAPAEKGRHVLQVALSRGFSSHQVSPTMLTRWANDIERQQAIKLPRRWRESLIA